MEKIEAHALSLSRRVWEGVNQTGRNMMTPLDATDRAGNVCFTAPDVKALTASMKKQGVLIWGSHAGTGRIRISTHIYNDINDVERCLAVLKTIVQ